MLLTFVSIVGGSYVLDWYIGKPQRRRLALRGAPRVPIADLGEGQVGRLVGVVAGDSIPAPLSGRPCVYFEILVEEGVHYPRPVIRDRGGIPFTIVDGSGRALIDPADANVDLGFDLHRHSGGLDTATAEEQAILARHGRKSRGGLRYHEAIIEPGDTIAVLGQGVRELDRAAAAATDHGYREAPPTLLRMRGGKESPLLITDEVTLLQ